MLQDGAHVLKQWVFLEKVWVKYSKCTCKIIADAKSLSEDYQNLVETIYFMKSVRFQTTLFERQCLIKLNISFKWQNATKVNISWLSDLVASPFYRTAPPSSIMCILLHIRNLYRTMHQFSVYVDIWFQANTN